MGSVVSRRALAPCLDRIAELLQNRGLAMLRRGCLNVFFYKFRAVQISEEVMHKTRFIRR